MCFPFIPFPSCDQCHLCALDATAKRSTPLESVGVAVQSVVLDAGQLVAACAEISACYMLLKASASRLTVVDIVRNASTAHTINGTHILLQACVRNTTSTLGNRTVVVGALRSGSRKSGDGKNDGSGGELHFE